MLLTFGPLPITEALFNVVASFKMWCFFTSMSHFISHILKLSEYSYLNYLIVFVINIVLIFLKSNKN